MNRPPLVASLAAVAILAADPAGAYDFRPRIVSIGGQIEVGGLRETISSDSAGWDRKTTDTYLTERISFSAAGWVYHPRFMLFQGMVGGGLAHEELSSYLPDRDSDGFVTEVLEEYEVKTLFLPEHPYNLELFAQRHNPYERGRLLLGGATEGTAYGAIFDYKKRPVAMSLSYRDSTVDSGRYERHTDTLSTNGSLFGEWGSLSGEAAHVESDGSYEEVASNSVSDEFRLENQLRWFSSRVTLDSAAGWLQYDQETGDDSSWDRRFNWSERLGLQLPWQLTLNLWYDRNDDTTEQLTAGGRPVTLESTTDSANLSVQHLLYQSLTTVYDLSLLWLDSTTGETTGQGQALSMTYTKSLPRGMLIATLGAAKNSIERSGVPLVVNEPHQAALYQEFTLQRRRAAADSVRVNVRSATTGDLVDLVRDTHYRTYAVGEEVRVLVFALPVEALSPDLLFVYSYQATYAIATETTTIDTRTLGGSLRLELLDRLVTPYASWSENQQDEEDYQGGQETLQTITTTVGLLLQRLPYSLTLESQTVNSDLNPYRRDRAQLDARTVTFGAAELLGMFAYRSTRYEEGEFQQVAFTEELYEASGRLQWRVPARHLTVFFAGTWNQATGLTDRRSYTLDAQVIWSIRQLEIVASASVGRTMLDMDGDEQESRHEMYYIKVIRRLF